ncbi:hypothetical protein CK503_00095 [Aliifodinibius salipaludis]|uniref:Uncharacterized protein n=1 Tax=Fodinibius salipaludis TaxID=2032627 RepID=A0A2A2GD81_9BACT|nr:hypothetical protein [Aliifodinibius salipaludis]PAU95501.1 hypothetical protein CK503_00095 [Aliifodinibius salipaludis]
MDKVKFLLATLFTFLLISPLSSQAQDSTNYQDWEKYDLTYRTYRITLLPGLSTNGIDAVDYVAKYSFNLLGGYHGALHEGFELGTLINANKYYASGVQIAGIGNYSGDNTLGVQIAGIGNYSGNSMQGVQVSGIGNWASSDIQGVQLGGVFNLSGGNIEGLQSAGVFNVARNDIQGLQFSGILNLSGDSIEGMQYAGAFNIAKNDIQGLLVSGVGNISGGNIQGLLVSGFANIARQDMQGIITSGGINYAKTFQGISLSSVNISQDFQGIQLGLANIVDEGQGIQAGLINYGNEFEGIPVGLISYYRDGRQNLDFWTTETGFTNIGIKLGTEQVYNMLSVGFNPLLNRDVWQVGWSIGKLREYENHDLYSDFSYFKINEGSWTKDLNSILKYRLLFGKEVNEDFKFYSGPTLNMLISRLQGSDDYAPYRLFDIKAKGRQYVFWIGATLGIELF